MSDILFLRLLQAEDKETALAEAVMAVRTGEAVKPPIYAVDPEAFGKVPGSPFAYWVSDRIRDLFQELPPFEGDGRTVKQGLATADDCRFVRAWWEVAPERVVTGTAQTTPEEFRAQTFQGKKWVPFAKGGAYSPYYADLHLLVNWENDGAEIKNWITTRYPYLNGNWEWVAKNPGWYFRPGLTWPRRTNGFSIRVLPAGAIFGDKGPAAFDDSDDWQSLLALCGILNTQSFYLFVQALLGRVSLAQSYEVGLMQSIPVPPLDKGTVAELARTARKAAVLMYRLDMADETSHAFVLPGLLQVHGRTLTERMDAWSAALAGMMSELGRLRKELDDAAFRLYGISPEEATVWSGGIAGEADAPDAAEEEDDAEDQQERDLGREVASLLSYALGCAFGRWDIQTVPPVGTPEEFDPFAPLAPCARGALTNARRLPAGPHEVPEGYPIPIQWDGILPDDEGHPADVVSKVRAVLAHLFGDWSAVEREACQALGVRDLRTFFSSRFFPLHIRQYSRSHRKAPIYWLLQSSRKSYGLWFYYPRLNRDTLYVALRDYVEPKLAHEQDVLARLKAEYARARDGGERSARSLARKVEAQEDLIQEIAAFRDEIRAVADAGYDPDLDDGVLINIAPLHRLVPWKEAAACYKELKAGKYPWASMYKRYKFR